MKRIMILLLECVFVLGLFSCTVSIEDDDTPDEENVQIILNNSENASFAAVEVGQKNSLRLSNNASAVWTVSGTASATLSASSGTLVYLTARTAGSVTVTAATENGRKYTRELRITAKDTAPDEVNKPNVSFINRSAYRVSVCRDGLTNEIAVVGAGGTESVYVSPGRGEITFHFRYSYCVIDDADSGTVWMAAADSSVYTYAVDSVDVASGVVPIQIPAPKNPTFRDSYLVVENISEQPVSLYNKNTQHKLYNQEKYYIQPQHSGVYSIQPDAPFEGFSLKSSSAESPVSPFHAESGVVYKCEFDGSGAAAVATEYVRQRELYTVTFEANGGTEILPVKTSLLNEPSMPAPEKQGYQFAGWYVDGECRQPVEYPYAVNADTSLYAKWIESGDTAYTVKHYQQNTDCQTYTLAKTETLTGMMGTMTAATTDVYKGFTVKSFEQKLIPADSNIVIDIYYDRNTYTVVFSSNNETEDTATQVFYYGVPQKLNKNTFACLGYTFIGWAQSETGDIVYADQAEFCGEYTSDVTLYAKWFYGIIATSYTVGNIDLTGITGEYTIKVVGAISQSTLTTLADKMKNKKDILVNLDLSEAVLETIEALDTSTSTFPQSIFYDCPLYSIVLPETLKTIGERAFSWCNNLKSVEITGVETIGEWAFYHCDNLESVKIDGAEIVGDCAFYDCGNLKNVVLKNITTIGSSVFRSCTNLSSIAIDAETIGYYAFQDCTSLTSVIIGKNVKLVGESYSNHCFSGCTALTSVQFEDTENWYRYNSSVLLDVTDAAENARLLKDDSERAWVKK